MKTPFPKKIIFFAKNLIPVCILVSLLFIGACSNSGSDSVSGMFSIKYPSEDERYFGEKGDFYVIGLFSEQVQVPGNIRIELFRGFVAAGTPVRVLESHVDPLTGVTPDSAIETGYAEGFVVGNMTRAPDLIKDPGGFRYPGNKVLVTKEYYGAIILGGSTKDFDTDYTDANGNQLEDLTEGIYTLKVTGLSGDIAGSSETILVHYRPIRKLFGGFNPANHKDKFFAYAKEHGYGKLYDPLPGYFSPISWSDSYMIQKRARLRNSLEVVNTAEGAVYGTSANARIGFILYNLKDQGATSCLEIGKALLSNIIDSPNTYFYYYNIGEPEITYTAMNDGERKTIDGAITLLAHGDRLVLTRAAIRAKGTGDGDNRYSLLDEAPIALDLSFSDGIQLATSQEFAIFGVVTPIPAAVTADPIHYLYYIADNRIARISYRITNAEGDVIAATTRDVTLEREYYKAVPVVWYPSIYEFEHEFMLNVAPGAYTVELFALDQKGNAVAGTAETFRVEYR
ncbi:MAG: hypothetical protein K4571_11415 [Deltaproteobacteria bacterium]